MSVRIPPLLTFVATIVATSTAVAAPVPPLGCYTSKSENHIFGIFCLRTHNVLASEVWIPGEAFGSCGKFRIEKGNRITFFWPHGDEGALIQPTDFDWKKPQHAACEWHLTGNGDIDLSNCQLAQVWKRLPDDKASMMQRTPCDHSD